MGMMVAKLPWRVTAIPIFIREGTVTVNISNRLPNRLEAVPASIVDLGGRGHGVHEGSSWG